MEEEKQFNKRNEGKEAQCCMYTHTVCAQGASSLVAIRCCDELKRVKLYIHAGFQ